MACLDDEKNARTMFCLSTSSQVHVVGLGKIPPVRLESGEIMRPRPMTSRTSKVSGGLVNVLVY